VANTISSPSWREDAPSAEETGLANLIGARNPMAAANLMIPEMQRSAQAQDAYHQTMAENNELQRQGIAAGMYDTRAKAISGIMEHAQPGTFAALRNLIPDMIPDQASAAQFEQSIQQNQQSKVAEALGKGNEGGVTPGPSVTPSGFSVGPSDKVQAAAVRGQYDLAGHALTAKAGNKDYTETITTPDNSKPYDTIHSRHYGIQMPSAAPPPPTTPVGQPTPDELNTKLLQLKQTNPLGHDRVTKAIANNGGKAIIQLKTDGTPGIVGADNVVY
jgi:hypothetical protein